MRWWPMALIKAFILTLTLDEYRGFIILSSWFTSFTPPFSQVWKLFTHYICSKNTKGKTKIIYFLYPMLIIIETLEKSKSGEARKSRYQNVSKHEKRSIMIYWSTKKTTLFYVIARRKRYQNLFIVNEHEECGIKICYDTKNQTSFYIKARRKRHHFILVHEESGIKIYWDTKNAASFYDKARRKRYHFMSKHEKISIKT